MRLPRIDQAMEVCEKHLKDTGTAGSEIEAFLTRYLLVLVCAQFEVEIKSLVTMRARMSGDSALESFVRSAISQLFRSVKTAQIGDLLLRFGPDCKERFRKEIDGNQRAETFFNNIVVNRHDTAHDIGSNVSFSELVDFYSEGHIVLDAVSKALEINLTISDEDAGQRVPPSL